MTSRWIPWTLAAATGTGIIGSTAYAGFFANRIVAVEPPSSDDLRVLGTERVAGEQLVTLSVTPESITPGLYGLAFNHGTGYARVGAVRSRDFAANTVTRVVEQVVDGLLERAETAKFVGSVYRNPEELGFDSEQVSIPLPVGPGPAWVVPAAGQARDTWAVMIHGRGGDRTEGLRSVPTAQALNMNSLLISYRNDRDAPAADNNKYGLGWTEWRDAEAAIKFALQRGAKDVVLFGYSMGGAISLQLLAQSPLSQYVRAVVLDAPAVNWNNILDHQAALNKVPRLIGRYGQSMLSHQYGKPFTGLPAPINLKAMNWVNRAQELRTDTLIIHSVDDDYVPHTPSQELAAKNPEFVSYVPFSLAGHTREWNVDPVKWQEVVTSWLRPRLG